MSYDLFNRMKAGEAIEVPPGSGIFMHLELDDCPVPPWDGAELPYAVFVVVNGNTRREWTSEHGDMITPDDLVHEIKRGRLTWREVFNQLELVNEKHALWEKFGGELGSAMKAEDFEEAAADLVEAEELSKDDARQAIFEEFFEDAVSRPLVYLDLQKGLAKLEKRHIEAFSWKGPSPGQSVDVLLMANPGEKFSRKDAFRFASIIRDWVEGDMYSLQAKNESGEVLASYACLYASELDDAYLQRLMEMLHDEAVAEVKEA